MRRPSLAPHLHVDLLATPQAHPHVEILALKCGLTNVLGIATGTGGQSRHNLHMPIYEKIGSIGSHDWNQDNLLKMHLFHTSMIAKLWTELENTPSAAGTLADETVILYVPTNGMTGEGTHHSISYMNNKNRAEWPVMMLSRIPGLRTGGDFIQFHPKSQNRTFAEFLHGLCEALSVDPSGFGKGSNGSDNFAGPMNEIRS